MSEWFEFKEPPKLKVKEEEKVYRIAICGSHLYENKKKIKDLVFMFVTKFKNENKQFEIISGGRQNGADVYVRKYALDFGCDYKEFNPVHTPFNLYSAFPKKSYNKPFMNYNSPMRNRAMLKQADYIVVCKKENEVNPDIDSIISDCIKENKHFIVIN